MPPRAAGRRMQAPRRGRHLPRAFPDQVGPHRLDCRWRRDANVVGAIVDRYPDGPHRIAIHVLPPLGAGVHPGHDDERFPDHRGADPVCDEVGLELVHHARGDLTKAVSPEPRSDVLRPDRKVAALRAATALRNHVPLPPDLDELGKEFAATVVLEGLANLASLVDLALDSIGVALTGKRLRSVAAAVTPPNFPLAGVGAPLHRSPAAIRRRDSGLPTRAGGRGPPQPGDATPVELVRALRRSTPPDRWTRIRHTDPSFEPVSVPAIRAR